MGKSGCVNSDESKSLGRKELAVMVLWEDREQPRCSGAAGSSSLVLNLHGVTEEGVRDGVSQLCSTG